MKTKILFVCTGNICRSPTAEEIFRQKTYQYGVNNQFDIDSAGTHSYHEGELPDRRMREHAKRRGYSLSSLSRPIKEEDFWNFDYIIDMDEDNRSSLNHKAPDIESQKKIHRMTDYCRKYVIDHVPDPYYGGVQGFENVLNILEDACEGLLLHLKGNLNQK